MHNESIYIKNVRIVLEDRIVPKGGILIEAGHIKYVHDGNRPKNMEIAPDQVIDATSLTAIPGFIDTHIHGANGADTMDATAEALHSVAEFLPREGTTSFLATTITQAPEKIEAALVPIRQFTSEPGEAELLGVHLEGPFVEKTKAGAQPLEHIRKPDLGLFKRWQNLSGGNIKTITLAPELDPDGSFIRNLKESGITVSSGHTAIGFAGMKRALGQGVTQVTHLCNAMNGIHHRDIGAVGAAFLLKELYAEIIADGIHVSPEMLQLIYNNIGSDRLILITDAMRAKGLPPGMYELGGQPVTVTDDRAILQDGTLAGSILNMVDGAKRMLSLDHVTLSDIVKMASVNPAKQIGVFDRKGSIAAGKDADILLVDDALNINYTICRGVVAFSECERS